MTIPKKPRVAKMFRLQREPAQQAHVLFYPEGMVKFNQSVTEILKHYDNSRDLSMLVSGLEQVLGSTGLQQDVEDFLRTVTGQGWIQ